MLTIIGKFLRKLRIDNGEILKEMADKLDVSSAFLSAVENGKKKMPLQWKEKLPTIYNFSENQLIELQDAIAETNNAVELNLENSSRYNRDLAVCFARHFDSIDEETSKKIMKMLESQEENDI